MIEKLFKKYIKETNDLEISKSLSDDFDIFKFEKDHCWINNDTNEIDDRSEFIRLGLIKYNNLEDIIHNSKNITDIKIDENNNKLKCIYTIISKQTTNDTFDKYSKEFKLLISELLNNKKDFGSIHVLAYKLHVMDDYEFPFIKYRWYEISFYDKTDNTLL